MLVPELKLLQKPSKLQLILMEVVTTTMKMMGRKMERMIVRTGINGSGKYSLKWKMKIAC